MERSSLLELDRQKKLRKNKKAAHIPASKSHETAQRSKMTNDLYQQQLQVVPASTFEAAAAARGTNRAKPVDFPAYLPHHLNYQLQLPITSAFTHATSLLLPSPQPQLPLDQDASTLINCPSVNYDLNIVDQTMGGISIPSMDKQSASAISTHTNSSMNIDAAHEYRVPSQLSGDSSRLTIFYADDVYVYENVSPEQAEAIMSAAGSEGSAELDKDMPKQTTGNYDVSSMQQQQQQALESRDYPPYSAASSNTDIPTTISEARRTSVLRFLEKRKNW